MTLSRRRAGRGPVLGPARQRHERDEQPAPIVGQAAAGVRRWALRVLRELRDEPLGFRALRERCDGMSSSVLRDRLGELVEAGIVAAGDDGRYGLTDDGRGLLVALTPLSRWAEDWGRDRSDPG